MTQVTNQNFLSPVGFTFKIKKLPSVSYFVQTVEIPGLTVNPIDVPNPFSKIPFAATSMSFEPLSVTFKVDENLTNYLELFDWMTGLAFPKEFDQFKRLQQRPLGESLYSDISLILTTSAKNANKEIVFYDAFPTSLSNITFASSEADIEYASCTVTFKYGRFVIQPVA